MGFIADILLGPHHILKVLLFKFNVEICGEKMNNSEFSWLGKKKTINLRKHVGNKNKPKHALLIHFAALI